MAKKKLPEHFFDEKQEGELDPTAVLIDPLDGELDLLFAGFPQHESCLELWRTTTKGGPLSFIASVMPSEFSFGNICTDYGGGIYTVKGKYKDGTGIKRTFVIEGEPFPIRRRVPAAAMGFSQPEPRPASASLPVEVPRREDGSYDMASLVTSMMGMMRTMLQENKGSKAEWLAELKEMRGLFGGDLQQKTPVAEAISMLKQGIELGSAAGESGGIPWMLVLDKLQGPLTDIVSTIKQVVTQPKPGAIPLPGPVGTTASPEPSAQGEPIPSTERPSMEFLLIGALKSMLPMLVTGAAQRSDPAFYSDLLLDQIPRQFYATAKTWLDKPDCIDQLAQMNPGVGPERLWFESLRQELIAALTGELSDAPGPVQPEPASHTASERPTDL